MRFAASMSALVLLCATTVGFAATVKWSVDASVMAKEIAALEAAPRVPEAELLGKELAHLEIERADIVASARKLLHERVQDILYDGDDEACSEMAPDPMGYEFESGGCPYPCVPFSAAVSTCVADAMRSYTSGGCQWVDARMAECVGAGGSQTNCENTINDAVANQGWGYTVDQCDQELESAEESARAFCESRADGACP